MEECPALQEQVGTCPGLLQLQTVDLRLDVQKPHTEALPLLDSTSRA